MSLAADGQAPEVVEPAEAPLALPALTGAPERASVLGGRPRPIGCMGREECTAVLSPRIQGLAVVRLVPDPSSGQFTNEAGSQRLGNAGDGLWRSSGHVEGERKTRAVCHGQALATLAPLGGAHPAAPLLASTQVPSMKPSDKSTSPRSRTSSAMALSRRSTPPARTHGWHRRWQVWYGGYRSGRSCHRAPVFRVHRMPSSPARLSRQGRPRPSGRLRSVGINGLKTAHCASVRSTVHLPGESVLQGMDH